MGRDGGGDARVTTKTPNNANPSKKQTQGCNIMNNHPTETESIITKVAHNEEYPMATQTTPNKKQLLINPARNMVTVA